LGGAAKDPKILGYEPEPRCTYMYAIQQQLATHNTAPCTGRARNNRRQEHARVCPWHEELLAIPGGTRPQLGSVADEQTWKKAPLQGLHPGPRDSLMIMGERTSGEHGCIQRPINAIIQEMYEQPMGFHATWRFSSLWVMMTYPSFRQSQITRNHIIHLTKRLRNSTPP
jgi:hypothetical protein